MKLSYARKFNNIPLIIMFSAVFLLASLLMYLSFSLFSISVPENYVKVEATIERIEEEKNFDNEWEYTVYVGYTFNDQNITEQVYGKYNSSMKKGDKVEIFVNPDNAYEFMTDTKDDWIFPALCGVFMAVGIGGVIYNVKGLVDLKKRREN